MRRTASEVIRELESRVARLERQASIRTADINDFDRAFKAANRDSTLQTLDAVELQNGDLAIVAEEMDMLFFLDSMGYHISKDRDRAFRSERGKLYILESSHKGSRIKGHLFVVDDKEMKNDPRKRIGYNFYKK